MTPSMLILLRIRPNMPDVWWIGLHGDLNKLLNFLSQAVESLKPTCLPKEDPQVLLPIAMQYPTVFLQWNAAGSPSEVPKYECFLLRLLLPFAQIFSKKLSGVFIIMTVNT